MAVPFLGSYPLSKDSCKARAYIHTASYKYAASTGIYKRYWIEYGDLKVQKLANILEEMQQAAETKNW